MNKNVKFLSTNYGLEQKSFAALLAVISSLDTGEKISTDFATLVKTGEGEFSIRMTKYNVSRLCEEISGGPDDDDGEQIFLKNRDQ